MLMTLVKPGDRVEMNLKVKEGEKSKFYITTVYDVLSDNIIQIQMPIQNRKIILLPEDSVYHLYFSTKEGMLGCEAKVTERYKSDNIYLAEMELTSALRKNQRREYYRLDCAIKMQCRILKEAVKEEDLREMLQEVKYVNQELSMEPGVIVDISGGGIRFIGPKAYEPQSILTVSFYLDVEGEVKNFSVAGKVLRSMPFQKLKGKFENRLEFTEISDLEREDIVKYIFQEERRRRRKEKVGLDEEKNIDS